MFNRKLHHSVGSSIIQNRGHLGGVARGSHRRLLGTSIRRETGDEETIRKTLEGFGRSPLRLKREDLRCQQLDESHAMNDRVASGSGRR